jgi:hypothetical protein
MRLITNHSGHAHWADATLVQVLGGFTLGAACDFGGRPMVHFFGPDPGAAGQLVEVAAPYVWPTASEALAALDAHVEASPDSVPGAQA